MISIALLFPASSLFTSHFSLFPLHSTPLAFWRGVGGEAFPSEGLGVRLFFTYKNHPS